MNLRVIPLELHEANALVAELHRHHKPSRGHRLSIGAIDTDGKLCAAAILGRPVSRGYAPREVLEVARLVSDGTPNACSFLYGAAARVAREMGFARIQTYTLEEELGSSLRASGWIFEGFTQGGIWNYTNGKERRTDQPNRRKARWAKNLGTPLVADLRWIAREGGDL